MLKNRKEAVPDLQEIEETLQRIENHIHRTPVLTSRSLDQLLSARIFLKCENFQKAGAFKYRGATNNVLLLSEEEKNQGVCTHSSGNHAQALARAARKNNIEAHIVMPSTSAKVKVEAVKNYGGNITFCEPTLEAREHTLNKVKIKTGAIEIHPYNNFRTIAGQATAAMELLQDIPLPDIMMAPVGGGGLMSGTALATSNISPKTLIVGAEPRNADDAFRSFQSKRFFPSISPDTIADGLLTSLGDKTLPIILEMVHHIVLANEESIINMMRFIWERMKIIIEPSSAVPLAALLELGHQKNPPFSIRDKTIGVIISGGNVDMGSLPWNIT